MSALSSSSYIVSLELGEESTKSVFHNCFTCNSSNSSFLPFSNRTKFTLILVSSETFSVGPIKVQPSNDRIETATGSRLPPCLSSSTQNASGTLEPISNLTCLLSISSNSISLRCGHESISSRSGMLLSDIFRCSTVQAFGTSRFRELIQWTALTLNQTFGLSFIS